MRGQNFLGARLWKELIGAAAYCLLLCLGGGNARGADKATLPEFLVRSWVSEDGLPDGNVQAVARTGEGYLWVGTSRGLARFDGVRFVTLTTNNTPELGDNRITCLLVTRQGSLWVGSEGGFLAHRVGGKFTTVVMPLAAQGRRINALAEDREGGLWIATRGAGLWRRLPAAATSSRAAEAGVGDWKVFTQSTGLPSESVAQVVADSQGRMWAISGNRLVTCEQGRWQLAEELSAVRQQHVAIAPGHDGGLWVATGAEAGGEMGCRVFKIRDRRIAGEYGPYPWPQNTFHTRVRVLFEDGAGRLWAGMATAGVYYLEPDGAWQALGPKSAVSQILVNCLAEDDGGNLWVGLDGAQLDQVRARPVRTLHLPGEASRNVIRMACTRRDGSVWVGTDGAGVYKYQNGNWTRYDTEEGLRNNYIGVIFEDQQTNLWVGTWDGLFRLEGEKFTPALGATNARVAVRAMSEDHEHNLWLGTSVGAVRLKEREAKVFPGTEGAEVMAIAEDLSGTTWAALNGRGLYQLVGERFEHARSDPWQGQAEIGALVADADGGMWLGTMGHGIGYLNDGKSQTWTSQDGLPSDWILALIQDSAGNLWCSSDNGMIGCPKARLRSYQRGVSAPVLCWQLSVADGLDTRRCSGNGQPVISGSKDGRIWFPNSHALAVFDPAALRPVGQALLPLLEEVIVDGEPVTPAANGEMRVTSATRGYELHYSSPTLQMPERLRFRFRLARWDPEWTDVGQRRVAYYGHLPPGEYEFNVMAGSPGGDWQAASAALRLIVVPRFWERRAVQLAGVILLLGAVGATVRGMERSRSRRRLQRAEAQQAMERERRRIARDLHDDLGGDLTEIMLLGEMAAQPATPGEKVREHAEAIATRSREAAAAMDEIIWTVNPRNDTVPRLADRVAEMARRRFDPLQAQLRVEIMEDIPDLPLPATARHGLFLAMKEAQNNAAKHSRATEVRVGVSCKDGCLVLTIDDNGCGFDSARLSRGRNGLENMRQRMGSIGGALELQSQPGEGTRVRFTYALPAANGK